MKKLFIGIGILIGLIFFVFAVARITGALEFYSIPTPSNEPTLKTGSLVFASPLKKYKRLDFICFEHSETGEIYVKRLCGISGDKIELKKGVLYINNQNVDKKLTLMHYYCIPTVAYDSLIELGLASESSALGTTDFGVYTTVVDSVAHNIAGTNFDYGALASADYSAIKDKYGKDWTANDFGPIIIPQDSVFVIGDNRDNSLDSRYFGFVAESSIQQTVLFKY